MRAITSFYSEDDDVEICMMLVMVVGFVVGACNFMCLSMESTGRLDYMA